MYHPLYAEQNEEFDTVYMLGSTGGRYVARGTLAREFNKAFFAEMVTAPGKKFFFKDHDTALDYQYINNTNLGVYKLRLPKRVIIAAESATETNDAQQLKIDPSQVTLKSIQNVTLIEMPSYQRFTISNPYVTGKDTLEIQEQGKCSRLSSTFALKKG